MSTCSLSGQRKSTGNEKISNATVALAFLTFISFATLLKLIIYAELKICLECSMVEIYDPLVIADATVLVFAIAGMAYLISKITSSIVHV